MADVSGVKERLVEQAAAAHTVAVESVIRSLRDASPKATLESTGRLETGVVETNADRTGPVLTATVESTARTADGVDYGEIQDRGTGPIFPVRAKVLHFTWNGVEVFAHSTRGVPATHWWTATMTEGLWHDALVEAFG